MRLVSVLLALPCLVSGATAQEGYPGTCDASALFECSHLAMRYLGDGYGTPPLPD